MKKIRVLMIDDNVNLNKMVEAYFSDHKEIELVMKAHDGGAGLDLILDKEGENDLVLLDLIMPNKDGIYVLDELKKRNITKNIIVATSYNAPEMIRKVS